MNKMWKILAVLIGLGMLAVVGCEWKMAEDNDTWDESMSWADFSGTYRGGSATVIPTNGAVIPTGGGLAEVNDEVVGVGNGFDTSFAGTLDGKPLYPGSLTITDGTEAFEDPDGTGILTGSSGGTGNINYNTGAFNVHFILQPSAGADVIATYIYYVGEGGPIEDDDNNKDTAKSISRITVLQEGNVLTFTDDDGDVYRGKMGKVTTSGGDKTGSTSGAVVGNFEVKGENGITIVGTFEGTYSAPAEGAAYGTMASPKIRGTWFSGDDTGALA